MLFCLSHFSLAYEEKNESHRLMSAPPERRNIGLHWSKNRKGMGQGHAFSFCSLLVKIIVKAKPAQNRKGKKRIPFKERKEKEIWPEREEKGGWSVNFEQGSGQYRTHFATFLNYSFMKQTDLRTDFPMPWTWTMCGCSVLDMD